MKQAATERQSSERRDSDQPIQPGIEEAARWSFEWLQSLREGPVTSQLIELIGKTRVTYPLRIYRIALDMGFSVKGGGEDGENIRAACITIGRAFRKLPGKPIKPNRLYQKAAREWLKAGKPDDKTINTADVRKLANSFLAEDLFLEGLNIVGRIDPIILRKFLVTADRPASRMPNYPLKFLLFALNKFLRMKDVPPSSYRISKVLSGFVTEQKIGETDGGMSKDAVKNELKRHNTDFVKKLEAFYERCQEAYLWPYMTILDLEKVCTMPRVFIENPDTEFPHLAILFPDWDEAFPTPQDVNKTFPE